MTPKYLDRHPFPPDYGLIIATIGSLITSTGVVANNILLDHVLAMTIWVPSNAIFTIYFYGRMKEWWNGHLSDAVMCATYALMLVSGILGLIQVWGLFYV